MAYHQPPARLGTKPRPLLCTHKRAYFLLFIYVPLVVIPWIITMILVYRPLTRPSWDYTEGILWKEYQQVRAWRKAIPIMNAFAAILAIPITSAVLAQAAVVFAQKRSPGQQMSVRHLFTLSDRAWSNWSVLYKSLQSREAGSKRVNWFVSGGALLVLLGAIQYPLFQILASWEEVAIPSCRDTRFIQDPRYGVSSCDTDTSYRSPPRSKGYEQIGADLEPAQLAVLPAHAIMPRVIKDLSEVQDQKDLPYLWKEADKYGYHRPPYLSYLDEAGFVAGLPPDTTTGVLREHIMRLDSRVSCTNLSMSAWPSTCEGTNPFQASFDYAGGTYYRSNDTFEICAPGDQGKHPWTLSRNSQDISEEVFFRFANKDNYESDYYRTEVMHCEAKTTRGYFELGNAYNGGQFGPLLEKWPELSPPRGHYQSHDWMYVSSYPTSGKSYWLSEEDHQLGGAVAVPDPETEYDRTVDLTYTNTTGPLMTSILALFGPTSWASNAYNLTIGKDLSGSRNSDNDAPLAFLTPLCDRTPFGNARYSNIRSRYCDTRGLRGLQDNLADLANSFSSISNSESALRAAAYLSNRAVLTTYSTDLLYYRWDGDVGRKIYAAEGWTLPKPRIHLASQIILTLIVSVHVLGLLFLSWWIQRWPAWTRTLDAMAIARVAACLDTSLLPAIKTSGQREREKLGAVDGLIGVQESMELDEQPAASGSGAAPGRAPRTEAEAETLSVASTAGKRPTNTAVPVPAAASPAASSVTLGLGAPGCIAKRGKTQVAPLARGPEYA